MSTLGEYITERRLDKGWSQRELARRANRSPSAISKLEGGQIADPGIDLLTAIAKALKISVFSLVLVHQGKSPNIREVLDKASLQKALHKAIDSVLDTHFPST